MACCSLWFRLNIPYTCHIHILGTKHHIKKSQYQSQTTKRYFRSYATLVFILANKMDIQTFCKAED